MHIKDYSQHLRTASYCGLQWRILQIKPDFNQQHHTDFKAFRVIRTRCNSKACPHCQKRSYNRVRNSLKDISHFHNWRFFTLTSRHAPNQTDAELLKLENDFRELRKKLQRKNKSFKYFAVKELSPSGMWHYHGVWNIHIDIKELSHIWEEISGAYRCYLEKVHNPVGAINYIFKYCYKAIFNTEELRSLYDNDKRKFSYSSGLFNKNSIENPYTTAFGMEYSVEEIKEELYNIISHSQFTIDDFESPDYPYFDDLIYNVFHLFYNNSPPTLFDSRGF